jgi:uncharacterized paraquat-inducible protein A
MSNKYHCNHCDLEFESDEARCPKCMRKTSVQTAGTETLAKTKPRYLWALRWSPVVALVYGLLASTTTFLYHRHFMNLASGAESQAKMEYYVSQAARHTERFLATLILLAILGVTYLGFRVWWIRQKRNDSEKSDLFDQLTLIGSLMTCVSVTFIVEGIF